MADRTLAIFGEALFDCFEPERHSGEGGDDAGNQQPIRVMGGAPFNVAWHLQALGDAPLFISRVGDDPPGRSIAAAMQDWGMALSALQFDPDHATGTVNVSIQDGEPHYDILENQAYDHIAAAAVPELSAGTLLYHGTLALRSTEARAALQQLRLARDLAIFIDINLREPWWEKEVVCGLLAHARWVKLNQHELAALGYNSDDRRAAMAALQQRYGMEQLILTCGEAGALVRTRDGQYCEQAAVPPAHVVDSVGAGDAFSAMYIHGLQAGWTLATTLAKAQQFASAVLGQRGATVQDPLFYQRF